jgi:hypothetical protein
MIATLAMILRCGVRDPSLLLYQFQIAGESRLIEAEHPGEDGLVATRALADHGQKRKLRHGKLLAKIVFVKLFIVKLRDQPCGLANDGADAPGLR